MIRFLTTCFNGILVEFEVTNLLKLFIIIHCNIYCEPQFSTYPLHGLHDVHDLLLPKIDFEFLWTQQSLSITPFLLFCPL